MTDDFFRARLDGMIDPGHALVVLAQRLPWAQMEQAVAPCFARKARPEQWQAHEDLFGATAQVAGGSVSNAGRPRRSLRLMMALTLLKNSFDLSDEELVARFAENVYWQHFAGYEYFDPTPPCDATQIGRFRGALGEAGMEELLKATVETAVRVGAVRKSEFERIIVDTTVQEKAIAHPVDSRLLEIARHKVATAAKAAGVVLKQTFAAEGKTLRRKAGGYAHAKQFKRLRKVVSRQRTVLGRLIRDVQRKQALAAATAGSASAKAALNVWLERAERIRTQQPKDKHKLYALHAPEVECIGKGKARRPYEFGVKVSVAVTHKQGLMVGARSFPGNPWDGHTLAEQIEQSTILLEDIGVKPKQVVVDLGYRGKEVDAANAQVQIIHRGRYKSMDKHERKLLKRRQAVEPAIGHLKADHRMNRCWLKGAIGDALHALSCAVGYNLRWLMRAVVRLGLKGFLLALMLVRWVAALTACLVVNGPKAVQTALAPA